jgi:hypothetical protein
MALARVLRASQASTGGAATRDRGPRATAVAADPTTRSYVHRSRPLRFVDLKKLIRAFQSNKFNKGIALGVWNINRKCTNISVIWNFNRKSTLHLALTERYGALGFHPAPYVRIQAWNQPQLIASMCDLSSDKLTVMPGCGSANARTHTHM